MKLKIKKHNLDVEDNISTNTSQSRENMMDLCSVWRTYVVKGKENVHRVW